MKSLSLNFILALFIIPILFFIPLALSISWDYPNILPTQWSTKYFFAVLKNPQTLYALLNTLLIAFATSFLSIVICLPCAKARTLYKFCGKKILNFLMLCLLVIPSLTISSGMHIIMIKLHLASSLVGIILVHTLFCLPYCIYIFSAVFEIIKNDYEQCAKNLGASTLSTFIFITVPLLMPAILACLMMSFAISLAQYISTFIIGGGKIITLNMILIPYIQSGQLQLSATYSLITIIFSLSFLILIEHFIKKFYKLKDLTFV
jgi:putative spermidine/putrescine transport system permease protein